MASSSSSDLDMSFTQDSEEYHEMHCEQCELYNEQSTAEGFCVECMEYMCTVCLKYHTRQNPGHRQQDKSSMPQDFCFEKCCTHTNRLIKYYCLTCKKFACNECKLTDHEKCTDIGHVPTVAKDVENSEELKSLFKDINAFNTELERFKDRLDSQINRCYVQENTLITAKNKQKEDMNRHIQEQKQLITDTYDREVEKTIEQLQAEKQMRINQLNKNYQQLDKELSRALSTIDFRHATEKTALQHFQANFKNVSSEIKDLTFDIEQKQKTGGRSNILITMKNSEQKLEKLRKEYLGLQKVVDKQKMDDSSHALFTALNEFKIVEQTYTLDFGATEEEDRRFGKLASNLFISEWKRNVSTTTDETEQSVLMHALTWTPFPYYLVSYYPKRLDILTEECVQYLVQAVSVLENVATRLFKGTLNIGVFYVISKRDSNFPELLELVQTTKMHTATSVRKEIEIRQQEMHKAANAIMRIVQTFNLKGDFEYIKAIADQNDHAITGVDDSVITECLMNMTQAKERCLAIFVRCKPLVQWMKELGIASIAGKKVLVDLMCIYAGDEPLNLARLKCFNCAVTGYAPLLFELDESCGSKELLQLCYRVWKELEADQKLPEKLIDTNCQLQWLRELRNLMTADGLIHITDLMQAETICTYGTFTVGKNALETDTNTQNIGGTSMVLANTLKLRVPEQTCTGNIENYTYSQVQGLQFKLGTVEKGTEIVDIFTMMFEGLTEIGMMYTKLCSAGCVLFKNWTANFFCDPDPHKQACVVLQFGQGDEDQLQGKKAKTEGIHNIITEIAKFMAMCLDEWSTYITETRKSYLSLNLFTLDQLMFLQTEVAKIETDSEPSDLVYPLLSSLKENCSKEDLVKAVTSSRIDLDDHHKKKRAMFIQELVLSGYNEALAMRALEEIDPEDITAGIVWCMDHEEDELSDDDYQPLNQSYEHMRKQSLQMDTQHLITTLVSKLGKQDAVGSGPLVQNLNILWRDFLKAMSFSMRDSISLNHLAAILNNLEKKSTTYIKRTLPAEFKEGQPNLVICEDESVFITALTVYMADKDQPHPQPDEVLICTKGTKTEEIDIFLRRAFCESKKIYCLVSVDMLTYDVDEYAARCVEEYLKKAHTGSPYRLVVISGYDKQTGFVASLKTFKRQPLHTSTEAVREYMHTKLSVRESSSSEYHPATVIDRDRYTVQVIKSWQAGAGKSLCVDRMKERLVSSCAGSEVTYIPLKGNCIHSEDVAERLLPFTSCPNVHRTRIFHIDIYHEVENGVDNLLFNLIVLGYLMDKKGFIWRRSPSDIFLIENTPIIMPSNSRRTTNWRYMHSLLGVLPGTTCRSPRECLCIYKGIFPQDYKDSDQLFDEQMYRSDVFQRSCRHLLRMDKKQVRSESDIESCLQTLLRHCGLEDPSWTDIHYFVLFLNRQLLCFENNPFVGQLLAFKHVEDFSDFVLKFLIKMSRNFATRSLSMTDESKKFLESRNSAETEEMVTCYTKVDEMQPIQTKHQWENSQYPCLFFNSDNTSFTFLGFLVEQQSGHLIDPKTKQVIELGVMHSGLRRTLVINNVPLSENFDVLSRNEKIMRLCTFMGIEKSHDPDETFILTTDIVKKLMAIHYRLRCDLPVIIMGETGCGKTRLVKFLCDIQLPPEGGRNTMNLIHLKVPGCSSKDIIKAMEQAEYLAEMNKNKYGDQMHTVLFLDGANATKDIGLIKEIMSDGSMQGKKLTFNKNLKIIAACNPYRKYSDKIITQMEQEGLGYHIDTNNTTDKLGHVPFWCLVYRVYPLPHSLLSLVWDFGQPGADVESVFISQIVKRYIRDAKLPDVSGLIEVISTILAATHDYMKQHMDEHCVISLRDVERALTVMSWFYQESQDRRTIFCLMDSKLYSESSFSKEDEPANEQNNEVDDITRSLILALAVSYHACLKERHYRKYIAQYFRAPCHLYNGENKIIQEIECCQEVFLDGCYIERNIACNKALKENVFMMVMCVELRIPLFLVGRPGSSKSLAKTIVYDAMQGRTSRTELFRQFKQAQMISFQCSPITAKSGIENTFRQCAQFQRDKALDNFVSVVVLDGVDMAENSPGMPLQVLPRLLDDGFLGYEKPEDYKKVAFIGISSHTLEPAVVNRGIFVQTEVPDFEELKSTAGMICNTENDQTFLTNHLIEPIVKFYLEIVEAASQTRREFFGLRDFYRFLEVVVNCTNKHKRTPTWHELLPSIKRNFGGFDDGLVRVEIFKKNIAKVVHFESEPRHSELACSLLGLVMSQLQSDGRPLLLMTDDYGSLNLIQKTLFRTVDIRYFTIFGSSFSADQESTKVCHYMNKIKSFMETGSTVILLNLDKLYGCMQDALNQYYVWLGGERYVDLGYSTHRVKSSVHRNFRLIVVEEKKRVYKKFPATLLSRFEKHVFSLKDTLSLEQFQVVQKLEDWVKSFVTQKTVGYFQRKDTGCTTKVETVFVGYHGDTCTSIVLDIWDKHMHSENEMERDSKVLQDAKSVLLLCATPESLVRLERSELSDTEKKFLMGLYFTEQAHDSLTQYLNVKLVQQRSRHLFLQITTHSQLISTVQKTEISKATGICAENISILGTLTSFQSEEQFVKTVQQHMQSTNKDPSLMIIQCDEGDKNANLIACARHYVIDQLEKMKDKILAPVNMVLIVQLQRGASFTGFQCGLWQSVHIDDLETVQI